MIDLSLFSYLAIGVAVVGAFLWLKHSKAAKASKKSGIGDQGQPR